MPWCGAPIRHYDHIRPVRDGGTTSAENIQGLCEACNQAKEAPDWTTRTMGVVGSLPAPPTGSRAGTATDADSAVNAGSRNIPGMDRAGHGRHTVETVTPTGHRYYSASPAPPGTTGITGSG
jgi:hypothetical protein